MRPFHVILSTAKDLDVTIEILRLRLRMTCLRYGLLKAGLSAEALAKAEGLTANEKTVRTNLGIELVHAQQTNLRLSVERGSKRT
jgi:hypothetical protein